MSQLLLHFLLLLFLKLDAEIELQTNSNCTLHILNENMPSLVKTIQSAQNYVSHNAANQLTLDSLVYSALQFDERYAVTTRSSRVNLHQFYF